MRALAVTWVPYSDRFAVATPSGIKFLEREWRRLAAVQWSSPVYGPMAWGP